MVSYSIVSGFLPPQYLTFYVVHQDVGFLRVEFCPLKGLTRELGRFTHNTQNHPP